MALPTPSTLASRLALAIAALLAGTAIALAAAVSASLLREYDRSVDERLLQLGTTLSSSGLRLDDRLLGWAGRMTRDELAVVQRDTVLASTLAGPARAALRATLARRLDEPAGRTPAPSAVALAGRAYRVAVVPLLRTELHASTWLVALAPLDALARTRRVIWGTAALAALATAALAVAVARGIARSVARPVEQLVAATERLAGGDLAVRVPASGPAEVARISSAFNAMAEALRSSRASLLEAERLAAVGKMAASVAHEVRNPLSGMRLSAQLAAGAPGLDAPTREALQAVIEEIDRLELVVGGLLDRARPRPIQPRMATLSELIDPMQRLLTPRLAHQGTPLRVEVDPQLPALPLDVAALKQVVYNLVLNAAEETRAGGEIVLRAERSGDWLQLTVLDRGRGFTAEALQRAFEPFFTTKPEGFGLGLANARSVIQGHGGRVEIANRDGGGARVTTWLPLRPPPA
jgi:signal transduction histidine kinase